MPLMKVGDLVTPVPHVKWVPLMSDDLEKVEDVNKTHYGNKVEMTRFLPGETAVVVEVNEDFEDTRVRLIFRGGFWWATAEELRTL